VGLALLKEIEKVRCSECRSPVRRMCKTISGEKAHPPHKVRVLAAGFKVDPYGRGPGRTKVMKGVACPTCGVGQGERCVRLRDGKVSPGPHMARKKLAAKMYGEKDAES
jgi:hypothetical protein